MKQEKKSKTEIDWTSLFRKNMELQGARHIDQFATFVPQLKDASPLDLEKINERHIWFWSDLHYGHKNIIKYSNRPFNSLDHMHEKLIEHHNAIVKEEDVVIWVGDVAFASTNKANEFLSRLTNAYRILVVGNHDTEYKSSVFKKLHFDEIHSQYVFDNVWCTHYPMSRIPYGYYNVHGHTHTTNTPNPRNFNVSVEQVNYTPYKYLDIIERASKVNLTIDEKDTLFDTMLDKDRHGNGL